MRRILGIMLLCIFCMLAPKVVMAGSTIQTATPLTLDDKKYDVTVKNNVREYFAITPTAGQMYYSFTLYNAGIKTVHYKLHNGFGVEYASLFDTYVYSGNDPKTIVKALNPGQTYLLEVWSDNSIAGVSVLQMYDDYANEHAYATPINIGETRKGNIEVSGMGECDFFAFTTSNKRAFYEVAIYNDGASPVQLTLYEGPNEAYSHESITADGGDANTITKELRKSNTYYIKVNGYYDRQTYYRISVKMIPDDASDDFNGAVRLKDGKGKGGKIQVSSDVDFYKFTTAKNKTAYQITIRNNSTDDVWFTLYTRKDISSGHTSMKDYHLYAKESQTIWVNLSKKHTYYIKVAGDVNSLYSLNVKNSVDAIKKTKPGVFQVKNYYSDHPCIYWKLTGQYAGYELWRSTHKGYGYKKIKTISKASGSGTYHYDDYTCKKRTTYFYKVRYYVRNNGKVVGGKFTKPLSYRRRY